MVPRTIPSTLVPTCAPTREPTASPTDKPDQSQKVTFREAKADYNQANWHVSSALDPNTATGWAVDGPTRKLPATAIFIAEGPFGFEAGTTLSLTLKHEASFGTHGIGRPRISLSTSDPKGLSFQGLDGAIVDAARLTPQKRTANQQQLLQAGDAISTNQQPTNDCDPRAGQEREGGSS